MADQRISQLPVADPIDGTELLAIVQAAVTKRMPISALTTIGVLSSLTVAGNTSLGGGTFVFNDAAGDYDFRVEGTTDQNLIRTDASTNNVGIGVAAPTEKLDVAGSINLATGNAIKINGTSVLNATTLGAGVTASSLTSVGTLTSLNVSGSASLNGTTIPANSTLVTTTATQTLTNKTLDDYTNNIGANSTHFRIKAAGNISKGSVVKATGYNPGEQAIEVNVVTSATDLVLGISEQTLTTGQFGTAVVIGELFDVNTNGFTVGAIIYSNGAGGFTETKPASGLYQPLGWIVRANSSNGVIAVNIVAPLYVEASTNTANTIVLRDGSGNFSAGTITATGGLAVGSDTTGNVSVGAPWTFNPFRTTAPQYFQYRSTGAALTVASDAGVNISIIRCVNGLGGPVLVLAKSQGTYAAPTAIANGNLIGSIVFNGYGGTTVRQLARIDGTVETYTSDTDISSYLSFNTSAAGGAAATERMRLDPSGNLGLGVTPSAWGVGYRAFEGNYGTSCSFDWNVPAALLTSNAFHDGTGWKYKIAAPAAQYIASGWTGEHRWLNAPSGTAGAAITFAQAMTLSASGNLGIGTTNPQNALTVTRNSGGIYHALFQNSSTALDARTAIQFSNDVGTVGYIGTHASTTSSGIGFPDRMVLHSETASGIHLVAANSAGIINFTTGGTSSGNLRWQINASGHLIAGVDATYDIGASGATRPRDMYLSGNVFPAGYVQSLARGINGGFRLPDWFIYNTTSGNALLIEQGSNFVRINSNGNVGLNVIPSATSGAFKIVQNGFAVFGGATDDTAAYVTANATLNSGWKYITTAPAAYYQINNTGDHRWYVAPSGTAGNAISFTQAMTLDASGNLSIGLTGNLAYSGLNLTMKSGQGYAGINVSATEARLFNSWDTTGIPMTFYLGGTERARITSAGDFGIGTTSPQGRLHVSSTTASVSWGTPGGQNQLNASTVVGDIGTSGGSFAVRTNTLNGVYASGFGVDGTYSGAGSVINLKAFGVQAGGYSSALAFHTSADTTLTERWRITGAGHLLAATDATYDIGASGANRPRTVFAATSIVAPTLTGTLSTAAQTNVTSLGVLTGLAVKNAATSNTDLIISGETGYAARLQFQEGNTARWYVGRGAWTGGNNYEIAGASSLLSTLDTAGNLGLGVTPSAWNAAYRIAQLGTYASVGAASDVVVFSNNWRDDGTNKYLNNGFATQYMQYQGQHRWYNAPSGTAGNAITFTQALTLDASGNLNLGQASSALQSGGTGLTVYGSSASEIKFLNSTSGTSATDGTALVLSSSDFNINNRESGAILFGTANAERARIDASGNFAVDTNTLYVDAVNNRVGVGTASPAATLSVSNGTQTLNVAPRSSAFSGFAIGADIVTNGNYALNIAGDGATGGTSGAVNILYYSAGLASWFKALSVSNVATGYANLELLKDGGNLGLGVTPSAWGSGWTALQISASGAALSGRGSTSEVYLSSNAHFNGSNWIYKTSATAAYYGQDTGQHKWYIAPSGLIGDPITFTQAMLLNASGDLYLGGTSSTTVPSLSRAIYLQNATANSTIGYSMYINAGSFLRGSMFLDDANDLFGWDVTYSSASPAYAWRIATGEKMRLDVNGNLLVGTTGNIYGAANRGLIEINGSNDSVLGLKVGNAGKFYMQAFANNAYIVASSIPMQIETQGNQPIQFATNGSIRLTLDGTGRVGLGSTGSFGWHSNYQPIDFTYGTIASENAAYGQTLITCNAYNDSPSTAATWKRKFATFASQYMQSSGEHYWFTAANGSAGTAISWTNAMTLNSNGSLALGASSATRVNSDTTLYIQGASFASVNLGVGGAYSGAGITLNDSAALLFRNVGAERARITAGGYFKASNDATYIGTSAQHHELRTSTSQNEIVQISHTSNGEPFGQRIKYTAVSPNSTGSWFLYCDDSTALRASIRSNGGLANYQSNNVDLSDARTKTDIAPASSMWSKIGALEIVTYKYTDQTHDDVNVGVIAQQVETVEPVWVDADGFGETPADGVPLKTVYTKDITFAAIKALQEAMARIESLEARLAVLETQP